MTKLTQLQLIVVVPRGSTGDGTLDMLALTVGRVTNTVGGGLM